MAGSVYFRAGAGVFADPEHEHHGKLCDPCSAACAAIAAAAAEALFLCALVSSCVSAGLPGKHLLAFEHF